MILIGLGGSLGALLRYLIAIKIPRESSMSFPVATLLINSSGSFLLGIIGALYMLELLPEWVWGFIGIGFLGAYTTFSTFGVEVVQSYTDGYIKVAFTYVILSVLLGIIAAGVGFLTLQLLI